MKEKVELVKDSFKNKKIIVGRDTNNQFKDVLHKLNAFEQFLEDFPELRRNVALLQITTPESDTDQQKELKVREIVSKINGKFGSLDYSPIHSFNQRFDKIHYLALLCSAGVLLVKSERETMYYTANEFIICQREKKIPLIIK